MNGCKAIPLCLLLAACSGGPLKLLTGAGPNVAANVQAGAQNHQTLGVSSTNDQRIIRPRARTIEQSAGQTGVRSEKVETVVVEAAPNWVWVLIAGLVSGALVGWNFPRPQELVERLRARGTE